MHADRNVSEDRGEEMNKKIRTESVEHLFDAILLLEDREECFKFFEDLCTITELQAPGKKRMRAADWLNGHSVPLG